MSEFRDTVVFFVANVFPRYRISKVIRTAYSNTTCKYDCKAELIEELGVYCAGYIDKYDQWYRVQILDWCQVGVFLFCFVLI